MSKAKRDLIEDIYPLSPLQQGILFHTLYAPRSGMYFQQWDCTLRGTVDLQAWQRAWQEVVTRHPVLRSAYVWERGDEPFQVVYRRAKLPWDQQDWRGLLPTEQEERLAGLLDEDRARGFDLSRPPHMRMVIIRMAEQTYRFIWSYHQMSMDGWSRALIMKEAATFYEAFRRGEELQLRQPRPYRNYVVWLRNQDLHKAEAFWRKALKGFSEPTLLNPVRTPVRQPGAESDYQWRQTRLSKEVTALLQSLARQHHLTLNTIVQGAWAIALSRHCGRQDVLFGVTVSGRPSVLSGVESMVGLFINTLPLRVQVQPGASLIEWLKQLQSQHAEMREFEYSPLFQIQGWSDVPRNSLLFESVIVFENYPMNFDSQEAAKGFELIDVHAHEKTNYPLTVIAEPGSALLLRLRYDCSQFDSGIITQALKHLTNLLEDIAANPEKHISALSIIPEEESTCLASSFNVDLEAY